MRTLVRTVRRNVNFHYAVADGCAICCGSCSAMSARPPPLHVRPRRFTDVIGEVTAAPGRARRSTSNTRRRSAATAAPGGAFEVKLQRSKRTIPVAADCSIADARVPTA